ncbi:HAD-IA family hydrolase [Dongia soli]|uniref:HAD-IA family hydrolase n=1 Tax=Dongia soli TaxID=600628 RepID=A0ABU5EH90_9PROT|nr:HAD-IA family hydrolase [Dongia soli]MDY0884855.1 HAD-IA family hydrolase [Dongia soli]
MRLIVFDIDGTLVDSREIILAIHQHIFTAHGLPVPAEEAIMGLVGLSHREVFTALVGADGPIDSLIAGYKERAWALRAANAFPEPLFSGAADLVDALIKRGDCRLAVATGKGRRGTDLLLERNGWTPHFSSSHTSDDCPSKPDPTMLLRAMAAAEARPAETVMIGDSVFDMQMALAAGATPIGVAWGHQSPAALRKAGATAIAEDFTDLARLLG